MGQSQYYVFVKCVYRYSAETSKLSDMQSSPGHLKYTEERFYSTLLPRTTLKQHRKTNNIHY
jgi:hypothetical protein